MFQENITTIQHELTAMIRGGACTKEYEKILNMITERDRKKEYGRIWTIDDVFRINRTSQLRAGIKKSQTVEVSDEQAHQILTKIDFYESRNIELLIEKEINSLMKGLGHSCPECGHTKVECDPNEPCLTCEIEIVQINKEQERRLRQQKIEKERKEQEEERRKKRRKQERKGETEEMVIGKVFDLIKDYGTEFVKDYLSKYDFNEETKNTVLRAAEATQHCAGTESITYVLEGE